MRAAPRALIVGGSLAGLNAALSLRDAGWDPVVFERSRAPLLGQGAGIVMNPATVRYFVARQVLDPAVMSVGVRFVRYLAGDGSIAAELPSTLRFTSYNALYQGLLGCLEPARYRLGKQLVGIAQDQDGVTLTLGDGSVEHGELLVCADGVRSTARRLLLPESSFVYAGYIAWRGTVAEHELSPAVYELLRDSIIYHLLPSLGHFLTYPIPASERVGADSPLINWLWYRNIAEGSTLDDLLTASDGTQREVSLPPGLVQSRHVATLQADASAYLPPQFAEVAQCTAQPFLQLICDLEVPAMAFGRVCLIGDAACVARPHVAAGSAKAAADAWALGEILYDARGDVAGALRRWEPAQLELGRSVVARARRAGERVQVTGEWQVGEPLPLGLYQAGDSEMPQTSQGTSYSTEQND